MRITEKWLKQHNACSEAITEFSGYNGNTEDIYILRLLIKKERLDWAIWLCTRLITHKQQIAYATYAAEQVIEIFEKQYPDDKRPRKAIAAAYAAANADYADYAAADADYAAAYAAAMKMKIINYGIKLLQGNKQVSEE